MAAAKRGSRDPWRTKSLPEGRDRDRQVTVGTAMSIDLPEPDTKDWRSWPTGNAAAALLHIAPMEVQRLWMTGEISRYKCPDNCYRFDPEQLAQWMQERAAAPTDEQDPHKNPDVVMKAQEQATRLLIQAQNHLEKLADLYSDPIRQTLKLLERSNDRLAERNAELEAKLLEVSQMREQMLEQMFSREIAKAQHEASERRKGEAWKLLMARMPEMFDALKVTIAGRDNRTMARVLSTIELLESLPADLVTALKELDVLDEKQKGLVDRILNPDADEPKGSNKPNGSSAEAEEQPGTPAEAGDREANGSRTT